MKYEIGILILKGSLWKYSINLNSILKTYKINERNFDIDKRCKIEMDQQFHFLHDLMIIFFCQKLVFVLKQFFKIEFILHDYNKF